MDWEVREPCGSAFLCRLHIELPSIPDYTRCSSPGFVDDCLNRAIHEAPLNSLDPRRAAEGRGELKRAPTRGAPTGGDGGLVLIGRCVAWLVGAGSHSERATRRGEARVAAGRQARIALTLAAARGLAGGVAGAEPPHKGGRLRPTAQLQWSVVSGQWSEGARGTVSSVWVLYWMGGVGSSWVNSYELLILAQYHTYISFL